MNLGRRLREDDDMDEGSDDLVERACHHLACGRTREALGILTEALDADRANMEDAKRRIDDFYFERRERPGRRAGRGDDEREERLDATLRDAASEVARVLNNVGVVHELGGATGRPWGRSRTRSTCTATRAACTRTRETATSTGRCRTSCS